MNRCLLLLLSRFTECSTQHSEEMDDVKREIVTQEEEQGSHKRLRPCAEEESVTIKMLDACARGDVDYVKILIQNEKQQQMTHHPSIVVQPWTAVSHQDEITGFSPLMLAAKHGHLELCQLLIQEGAPWNAIDRTGNCAGNYATNQGHWDIVNFLVDVGVQAELILGMAIRNDKSNREKDTVGGGGGLAFDYDSHTKPDYIHRNVRYNIENTALLDQDDDAVMMEWERPLMEAHAHVITSNGEMNKRVLNVGFGMGIIDSALQNLSPSLHVIVEAHPLVYKKMMDDGWDKKKNVMICFGKWQDVLPQLINENITFDGIFYDTYGEHFTDFEDFHNGIITRCLAKNGVYSFFNGLCPDNLFFQGVACQCIQLQVGNLGFDCEFLGCDIDVKESDWDGIKRKYWHNDTYYLPKITWKGK